MKTIFCLLFIVMIISSCKSEKSTYSSDTVHIIQTVLTSKTFFKNLEDQADTIYILKSKLYQTNWPSRVNQIYVRYIEDTKDARKANMPNSIIDKRMRYNIPQFSIKGDSAYLALYNFNFVTDMRFYLHKESDEWRIVKYEYYME